MEASQQLFLNQKLLKVTQVVVEVLLLTQAVGVRVNPAGVDIKLVNY